MPIRVTFQIRPPASLSSSALLRYGLWKLVKNWPESGYRGWHYQKWCLGSDCQPCFWLVERYQWLEVEAISEECWGGQTCGWSYLKGDTYRHILNLNHHDGAFALKISAIQYSRVFLCVFSGHFLRVLRGRRHAWTPSRESRYRRDATCPQTLRQSSWRSITNLAHPCRGESSS